MHANNRWRVTEGEYLDLDAQSEERHEFYNGEAIAMAGADPAHGAVVQSLGRALGNRLEGRPCLVWSESQRVRIDETTLYAYPDLVVTFGRPQFADTQPPTLLNPRVIIEVLSPSTELHDRGAKFKHYLRRASLQEYLMVEPTQRSIDQYVRASDGWTFRSYTGDDVVELPALEIQIPLAEIYAQVELLAALTAGDDVGA